MKAGDLVKIRGDIYNTGYSEHIKVSHIILQQINKIGIVIKITKYIHINERVFFELHKIFLTLTGLNMEHNQVYH